MELQTTNPRWGGGLWGGNVKRQEINEAKTNQRPTGARGGRDGWDQLPCILLSLNNNPTISNINIKYKISLSYMCIHKSKRLLPTLKTIRIKTRLVFRRVEYAYIANTHWVSTTPVGWYDGVRLCKLHHRVKRRASADYVGICIF